MKRLLIFFVLFFCASYTQAVESGGDIGFLRSTIPDKEKRQKRLYMHMSKIDQILQTYEAFSLDIKNRLRSIIIEGAQCNVIEEKYSLYKKKYGNKANKTVWAERAMNDCLQMKENRLIALRNIERKFVSLKGKVDDLAFQRTMSMDEANRLKEYIDNVREDIRIYKRYSN